MDDHDDEYDQKFAEMQKYIPFLEAMIERLLNVKDKSREVQLQKMQSLHGILFNSKRKLKIETLQRCENVLQKLYNRVEKGNAPGLQLSIEQDDKSTQPSTSSEDARLIQTMKVSEESPLSEETPASPDPSVSSDLECQILPIIIPTERSADFSEEKNNTQQVSDSNSAITAITKSKNVTISDSNFSDEVTFSEWDMLEESQKQNMKTRNDRQSLATKHNVASAAKLVSSNLPQKVNDDRSYSLNLQTVPVPLLCGSKRLSSVLEKKSSLEIKTTNSSQPESPKNVPDVRLKSPDPEVIFLKPKVTSPRSKDSHGVKTPTKPPIPLLVSPPPISTEPPLSMEDLAELLNDEENSEKNSEKTEENTAARCSKDLSVQETSPAKNSKKAASKSFVLHSDPSRNSEKQWEEVDKHIVKLTNRKCMLNTVTNSSGAKIESSKSNEIKGPLHQGPNDLRLPQASCTASKFEPRYADNYERHPRQRDIYGYENAKDKSILFDSMACRMPDPKISQMSHHSSVNSKDERNVPYPRRSNIQLESWKDMTSSRQENEFIIEGTDYYNMYVNKSHWSPLQTSPNSDHQFGNVRKPQPLFSGRPNSSMQPMQHQYPHSMGMFMSGKHVDPQHVPDPQHRSSQFPSNMPGGPRPLLNPVRPDMGHLTRLENIREDITPLMSSSFLIESPYRGFPMNQNYLLVGSANRVNEAAYNNDLITCGLGIMDSSAGASYSRTAPWPRERDRCIRGRGREGYFNERSRSEIRSNFNRDLRRSDWPRDSHLDRENPSRFNRDSRNVSERDPRFRMECNATIPSQAKESGSARDPRLAKDKHISPSKVKDAALSERDPRKRSTPPKTEKKTKNNKEKSKLKSPEKRVDSVENNCKEKPAADKLTKIDKMQSPLQSLYGVIDTKSGHSSGLQKFKIPKIKRSKPTSPLPSSTTSHVTDNTKEADSVPFKSPAKSVNKKGNSNVENSDKDVIAEVSSTSGNNITDISNAQSLAHLKQNDAIKEDIISSLIKKTKESEEKTDKADYSTANNSRSEEVSKKDPKDGLEGDGIKAKEEVTQKWIEALIRKSLENSEGKELVEHAKLIRKLGEALKAKKLKKIKRIIESESESSSSDENETIEQKKMRTKKKRRVIMSDSSDESSAERHDISSTDTNDKRIEPASVTSTDIIDFTKCTEDKVDVTSNNSSEVSTKNVTAKKNDRSLQSRNGKVQVRDRKKKKDTRFEKSDVSTEHCNIDSNKKNNIRLENNHEKENDRLENSNENNSVRLESDKPIDNQLEDGKEEQPKTNVDGDFTEKLQNTEKSDQDKDQVDNAVPAAELDVAEERANESTSDKPKARTKRRNSLEMLQEDIRDMFISEGVVSATGYRMCRLSKESQSSSVGTSTTTSTNSKKSEVFVTLEKMSNITQPVAESNMEASESSNVKSKKPSKSRNSRESSKSKTKDKKSVQRTKRKQRGKESVPSSDSEEDQPLALRAEWKINNTNNSTPNQERENVNSEEFNDMLLKDKNNIKSSRVLVEKTDFSKLEPSKLMFDSSSDESFSIDVSELAATVGISLWPDKHSDQDSVDTVTSSKAPQKNVKSTTKRNSRLKKNTSLLTDDKSEEEISLTDEESVISDISLSSNATIMKKRNIGTIRTIAKEELLSNILIGLASPRTENNELLTDKGDEADVDEDVNDSSLTETNVKKSSVQKKKKKKSNWQMGILSKKKKKKKITSVATSKIEQIEHEETSTETNISMNINIEGDLSILTDDNITMTKVTEETGETQLSDNADSNSTAKHDEIVKQLIKTDNTNITTDITTLTNLSASPESSSAVQKTSLNESFSETDTLALEIKTNEMKSSEDEQSIDVKMLQSVSEDRSSTIMYDEHMEKVFGRVNLKELIDYAWTGQEKYKCLICFFTTKNIVHHYKICHSNNEILIARLNPESAEAAITGAESSMTTTTEETNTNQVSNIYRCRFCCYVTEGAANVALEAFYEHCTTHTGEYRYHCKCCPYQAVAKASMRTHYYKMCRKFNNTFKECVNEESIPEENGMYGYLCRKCNYVQLKRENVELHAKFWHRDETDTEIVKINMSAAITETATIDNENSQKCSVDAQTPFPETIKSEVKPQVSELEIKSIDVLEDVSMDMKTESAQTFQANTDIVKTTESQRKNSDISEEHDDSRETATEKDTIVKVTEESNEMLKLSPGEPEGSVSSGNLSVFVCPPELENKEVEIQLERKKKMQEIAYNIGININKNFTKSGLSIIDKLQDKMRTDTVVSSVIKSDELTNAPQPRESSSMSVINPTTESVKLEENIGVSKDKLTDELMIEHENTSSRETLVDITLESVNSNTDKAEVKIRDPLVMDPSKNSESDDDVSDTETLRRSPVFESESSSEQSDSEPTDVNMILKETSSINASSLRDPMLTTIQRLAAQLQSTKPLEVSFTTDNVKFKNEFASPMASLPITSTPIILSRKQVNASPFGNAKQSSTKSDSDKYHEKTPLITCNDANPPTNFIRLRRLSGDMLSMTLPLSENPEDIRANTDRTQSDSTMDISQTDTEEECSFLKIENVVSLAPKSDSEVENPIVNDIRKAVEISPVKNKNMALNNNSPQALLLKMNVVKRLLKNNTNIQAVQPTTSAAMTLIPMKNMNKISNRPNILSKDTSKINIPVNKSSVNPDNTTKTVPASSSSTNTNCARMKMLRTSSSSTDTEQPNSLKVLKLKSTESYSAMMKATKLAHFYKCMAHDCVYTTDSVLLYYQHYHEHCEKSEKEHSTSPYDYQKCVYCYVTLNDWNSIRHHMWEEHGHCRYQCGYCFYRAVVPSYVLQHQICFHADSKYYLLTGKMGKAVPKQENIKRIEYVLPFVCVRDCGKFFYVIDTFVKHLTLKHKNYESTFQCHMCKCTLTSVELLLTHYKSHGLAKYQCIYCVYGSDDSTELHQHLSTYHFEQLPQIVERTLPPTPILNVEVIDQLVVRTFDDFGKLNDGTHAVRTEAASSKKVTTTNPLNVLMYPDPNNVEIALNQEQTNILNSVVPNLAEKIGLGSTEVTVSVFDVTLKNKKNALSGKTGEIDSKNTDKLTTIQKSEKQPSREEHLLNNVNEHKSFKQIEKEKPSNHATKQVLPEMDLELLSCMNTSSTEDSLKSFSDFNCSDEFVNTNLLDNIDFLKTLTKSNKTSFCKNDAVVPEDKMDDSDIEILENIVNEKVVDKKDVKDNGTKQKKDSLSFKQETEKKDLSTSDSNEKDLPTTCDTVGKDSSVICDTIEKDLSRTCDTVGKESSITCDTVEKDSSTMYDTVEKDLSTTCDADEKDLSTTCDTTEKESTSEETVVNATTKPLTLEDIKHTGYMGTDLYKCGNEQCNFAAQTAILLKSHIRECSFNTKNENFHCAHCKKRFIKVSFLLEHLKVHGLKRFGCSLCKKRYPVSYNATAHMKTKHKFPNTRLVPADPTNPSVDGLFIVQAICLKGNERRTKKRKGQKPTEQENENEKTVDKEKSSFNPNEIDQLPRQAIYFREVQCAVCPYTTKVRTNIVRHLQLHAKDETVPETGPVNPVPCLDKKERMFDKMVNLASSSHPNCRMGAKPKEVLKENDDDAFPKFVPEHKRYVCGVVECNYLTVHESMLRYHLKALHSEEPYFRCPHCPQPSPGQESQNIAIDKMGVHLKMHDTRLYKCSHCNHHHYQRHVVERHLADKHPEKKPFVKVIRELDNTENVQPQDETEEEVPDPNGNHWKCNICDFKCVYKAEMSSHALTAHDEKFQYKCSLCSFKTSARILFEQHISSKHAYDLNIDFVLVYQRIKGVNKRSSDTPEQSVQEEPFDTTPLWRRDMPRVRHIRGILLEEEQDEIPASEISSTSSKTSKRKHEAESTAKSAKAKIEKPAALEENKQPKEKSKKPLSCEKLSEEAEGDPQNVKKSTYKFESRDTTNKLATESTKTTELSEASDLDVGRFGPYGKPDGNMYICTLCNMFKTKYKFDMRYHLYKELKYARWHCKACGYLSVNRNSLLQHFTKCHNGERPNHEPLSPDNAIEEWVMTLLKKQTDMIKAATQQTNKDVTNKSVTTPVNVSAASPGVINAEKMSETRAVDLAPAITTLQTDILRDANRSIDTDDGDSKDNEDLVIDMREDEVLESSNIENISESDKTSEKDEPKVLICKHCHMKFTRIRGIKKHIQLTHLKRLTFLCPYCDRSSNLESLVLQHIRSKHPGCAEHIVHNPAVGGPELTNEFWEKEYGLVSPREKKTTKKKRKLNKSGESDDSKNSNNRAQEMCEVCGFLAVNYTGLKAHMRSHMPKHSIKCVYCTYTSSIRAKLIEHWEINHPSLPFQIKTISEIDPLVKTNDKKLPQNDKLKTPQNKLPQNDQKLSVNKKRSLDTSSDSIENECADSVDGAPSTTVTLYSCCYCNFHRRSLVFIKRHWNLVHKETKSVENGSNAPATVTNLPFRYQELIVPRSKLTQSENETKKKKKIELPRTFTSEQMEEYLARSRESLDTTNDEGSVCQWCQEFCKTDDMEMHHTIFHSHLPLNFKTLKQQSRDQPKCIPERVSTHCAEKHPGLPTKIDSISNFHSIVDDLVKKAERYKQIDGNGDCDDKGNGSNKGNGDSKGDGTGSGVMLKSETSQFLARSTNPPAVTYAVARKSTTKSVRSYVRPGPRRFRAVALKSTNPLPRYLRETMKYKVKQQQGTAMKMESDEVNRNPPWSFYRVPKDPINLAKLNTYMVVGGHSMRVNCSTLAQLININPKVILKDITYNPKNTANLSE